MSVDGDPTVRQLQRADPDVVSVVARAKHVAVYTFRLDALGKEVWERDKVEGACFVVRRRFEPRYAVVVLNRVGSGDLIEYLKFGSADFDCEFNRNFFIYRVQENIRAIWLAEDEYAGVQEIIERAEREVLSTPPTPKYMSKAGENGTLLTMEELRDSLLRLVTTDQFMHKLHAQYLESEYRKRAQPSPSHVSPVQHPIAPGPGFVPPFPNMGQPPRPPQSMFAQSGQPPLMYVPQQAYGSPAPFPQPGKPY